MTNLDFEVIVNTVLSTSEFTHEAWYTWPQMGQSGA